MRNLYKVFLNSSLERELYDHLMAKFEFLTVALMKNTKSVGCDILYICNYIPIYTASYPRILVFFVVFEIISP